VAVPLRVSGPLLVSVWLSLSLSLNTQGRLSLSLYFFGRLDLYYPSSSQNQDRLSVYLFNGKCVAAVPTSTTAVSTWRRGSCLIPPVRSFIHNNCVIDSHTPPLYRLSEKPKDCEKER
jgi:hypothetical protein